MDHFETLNEEDEAKRIINKFAVLTLIGQILRPHWIKFALGFVLIIINRALALMLPASTRLIVDQVLVMHQGRLLPKIVLALAGSILLQSATFVALITIFAKGGHAIVSDLRIRTHDHVQRLHLDFFRRHRSGELTSQIIHDLEDIRKLVGVSMIDCAGSAITAAFSFVVLFRLSFYLTVFPAVAFTCFIVFLFVLLSKIHPTYRRKNRAVSWVAGRLTEGFSGIATIKAYGAEQSEACRFREAILRVLKLNLRIATLEGLMFFSSGLVGSVVAVWVIYTGTQMVLEGRLTLGTYLTYNIFLAYLAAPITLAVNLGTQLSEAFVSLSRTSRLLGEKREEEDPDRTFHFEAVKGRVQFEHVTFRYENGRDILTDLSFSVAPGQMVAIVGPSGSGKSTVASLLCAFENPSSGCVTVDGIDLTTVVPEVYRRHLGVVFQDSFLFQGTLFDNVEMARIGAKREDVISVCKIARVHEFTNELPNGYDTLVGERGVKLSGGQRQRVAIARALLSDPKILILDEATASLDSEAEHHIQSSLQVLMQGRTTLVIAHRLSTIQNADEILVLENGKIVERGCHAELLEQGVKYKRMWELQQAEPEQLSR